MLRYGWVLFFLLLTSGPSWSEPIFKFKGLLQYDTGLLGYSEKSFGLRRAQTDFTGTINPALLYRVNVDFASGTAALQDAYGDIKIAEHQTLRVGKSRFPGGLERIQAAGNLLFPEFGLTTFLVPNKDNGFLYIYKTGDAEIDLGLFSGSIDGGLPDTDSDYGRVYTARVFVHPIATKTETWGVGVGGNIEDRKGSATTSLLATYRYPGYGTFFSYSTGVFANGQGYRFIPQTYLYAGPFGLLGEYVLNSQAVSNGSTTANLRNTAWQVYLQWVLTGERATFDTLIPRSPLREGKGIGAWQLGLRYGEIDFDDRSETTFATTAQATKVQQIGASINWFWTENVKWVLAADQLRITAFTGGETTALVALIRTQVLF
ncbi:MAG: porin [Candidatus Margulisiibacteriota bacterium]